MAEGTGSDLEDRDFDDLMLESDVRGYLYEPQYSDEQLQLIEEPEAAAAATAEAEGLKVADEEPGMARAGADWWCLCSHCAPMDTEVESVCCKEFQRCRFLLDEISDSDEDTDICVVDHPSFAAHMDSGVLDTYFRIPKVNWKRQPKPAGTNGRLTVKQYRLTVYRHFLEWVLQGERLGRGSFYLLASCRPSDKIILLQTASTVDTKKLTTLRRNYEFHYV
ncbi:uncharacterized protein LOC130385435 [Gadus chalcogrammus]|uniref:uncharacterized protein LOC130385435 n=1 Tax=Gadus chalcogrammus TaxID=1042646 RepID=UPI0024C35E20|nr:uncharacterized protein LOC130385435 [Gadus chalcogrammus]